MQPKITPFPDFTVPPTSSTRAVTPIQGQNTPRSCLQIPLPSPAVLLLCLAALLSPTDKAAANLRAPASIPDAPSTALRGPVPGILVKGEKLTFACQQGTCAVEAIYSFEAEEAASSTLEFILPEQAQITVKAGQDEKNVPAGPAEPLKDDEAEMLKRGGHLAPLYRATFAYDFVKGENTLVIRYDQPLGGLEMGHTKHRDGRFVYHFRYELWPLSTWTLSPDFSLKLAVSLERPEPSWWQSWFGTDRSIQCTGYPTTPAIIGTRTQRGDLLWYEAGLGKVFPEVLTCYIGDEDLLPGMD